MVTIFHGNNPSQSRQAFFDFLSQFPQETLVHLDSKSIEINQINNYLNGGALFPEQTVLAVDNLFSVPKATLDKIIPLIIGSQSQIILWQDKALTAAQIKLLPQAKINSFKSDNQIFFCLNSIRPRNLALFNRLYEEIISQNLFDLFLYLLKGNLRRQLAGSSTYPQNLIQKIYLQVIELEFQYKTGQLSLPREIALKRVLVPLMK